MTNSNLYDKVKKLACNFTLSSKVYSDALSQLTHRTASIEAVSRAFTKQFETERKLFGSTRRILEQINQTMGISQRIQALASTNLNLTRMAEQRLIAESSFAKIFEDQKRIQDMIEGVGIGDSLTAAFARVDTTRILSASLAAQAKFANLDGLSLGRIAGIDSAFSKAMTVNLENLTHSYRSLIDIATTRDSLARYLPFITTYSPVEYYREIEVLEAITVEEDLEDDVDKSIDTTISECLPSVDGLLEDFNPSLCHLLEGARQALRVNNPDRARHVTTSVRELFTQVLHALAPDKNIQQWTTDSECFHNNRPTRRARLLYICRNINCDPLKRFVEDDVRAALSFVNSLHSGTHAVESKLTPAQLSSIISRMESLLVFLLQLRNYD